MDFKKFSELILKNKQFLVALAIINFVGFMYGIYYYNYQLSITPIYLWIFAVDSPLPVLLFVFVSYFFYYNKKVPQWLLFATIIGLVKYGFWTALVILLFFDYFFGFAPVIYAINLPLHAGMVLEGFVLTAKLKPRIRDLIIVLAFFLVNDVLDYFFGTLPIIPNTYNSYLLMESLAVTIILPIVFYFKKKSFVENLGKSIGVRDIVC